MGKDNGYEKAITAATFAIAMEQLFAHRWADYELLDIGRGQRLERFGNRTVLRPDVNVPPQLAWTKAPKPDATFLAKGNSGKGTWSGATQPWTIQIPKKLGGLSASLHCTPFKHVGLFPEQVANWSWLDKAIGKEENLKVLNLFAYTGMSSLLLRHKGCDVVHVESSKTTLNWARKNMEANELSDIRWCLEDAFAFIAREVKRGNRYHGIIMDPPAFGISGKGKRWSIENMLEPLIANAVKLLDDKRQFLVLNTYSPRAPYEQTLHWLQQYAGRNAIESGSLCLKSNTQKSLHTGHVFRFNRT